MVPVYSNTTASLYPQNVSQIKETLAHQLAQPVQFSQQIKAMYADGVRTFIEVGPHSVLSSLVGDILKDQSHQAGSGEDHLDEDGAAQ